MQSMTVLLMYLFTRESPTADKSAMVIAAINKGLRWLHDMSRKDTPSQQAWLLCKKLLSDFDSAPGVNVDAWRLVYCPMEIHIKWQFSTSLTLSVDLALWAPSSIRMKLIIFQFISSKIIFHHKVPSGKVHNNLIGWFDKDSTAQSSRVITSLTASTSSHKDPIWWADMGLIIYPLGSIGFAIRLTETIMANDCHGYIVRNLTTLGSAG